MLEDINQSIHHYDIKLAIGRCAQYPKVMTNTTYSLLYVVLVNTQIKSLSFLLKPEKVLTHFPTLSNTNRKILIKSL